MRLFYKLAAAGALLAPSSICLAQTSPPAATTPVRTTVSGTVLMLTQTPVGDLDGVILSDGTEVHTPPHLSSQLAAAVQPRDQVRVDGWTSWAPGVVSATTLSDLRSNITVVDQGPPAPGAMPPPPPPGTPAVGSESTILSGQVERALHGPAGDVNGAVLADGTQLRLSPAAAYQSGAQLQPGQSVTVKGFLLTNNYGRVMDVQALGSSPDRLAQAAPPPGGPGAPPPPPPGAPGAAPPPPGGPGAPPPPPPGAPGAAPPPPGGPGAPPPPPPGAPGAAPPPPGGPGAPPPPPR